MGAAAAAKTKSNFFGNINELPDPVRVDDMTRPSGFGGEGGASTGKGEYIPFEPIKNGGGSGGFDVGEMFAPNIEEQFAKMEGDLKEEQNAQAGAASDTEGGTTPEGNSFGFNEMDAEMFYETWNNIRITAHDYVYDWAIYRQPKKAREVLKELSYKTDRTKEENELMKALWDYTDKHTALRDEYIAAVPYTDKHRGLCIRYISYLIERMQMQGKSIPKWLIGAYIFVVPEAILLTKLAALRAQVPEFKFDMSLLKK